MSEFWTAIISKKPRPAHLWKAGSKAERFKSICGVIVMRWQLEGIDEMRPRCQHCLKWMAL